MNASSKLVGCALAALTLLLPSPFTVPVTLAQPGADSCKFARDGECDEPSVCPPGTDTTDCKAARDDPLRGSVDPRFERPSTFTQEASWWEPLEAAAAFAVLGVALAIVLARAQIGTAALWLAAGLLLIGAHWLGLTFEPFATLMATVGGAGVFESLRLASVAGAALVVYGLFRLLRGDGAAVAKSGAADASLVSIGLDMVANDGNPISEARRLAAKVQLEFESILGESANTRIYGSPLSEAVPWLRVEHLCHDEHGARATFITLQFRIRPFESYPVVIDIHADNARRKVRINSIIHLASGDVQRLVDYMTGKALRLRLLGLRARQYPWQFWRPAPRLQPLEAPWKSALRQNLVLAVGAIVFVVLVGGLSEFLSIVAVLAMAAILAYRYWWVPAPRYRITTGRPAVEPRSMLRLDSWHSVLRDLGDSAAEVLERFKRGLRQAGPATDGAQNAAPASTSLDVRNESIWYLSNEGKVERSQLVVRLRRAFVFVHVYPYGRDLFVAWDGHVNAMAWTERLVTNGRRHEDGRKVALYTVEPGVQPINEYDITDSNFLIEAVHANITQVIKELMLERKIDQELDFAIVREPRSGLNASSVSESEKGKRRAFLRRA